LFIILNLFLYCTIVICLNKLFFTVICRIRMWSWQGALMPSELASAADASLHCVEETRLFLQKF
jgi:hypothetical protein